MQIVITGATGGLGEALVRSYLANTDAHIVGLSRRAPETTPDAQRVTYRPVDLGQPASLAASVAELGIEGDVDALIHCAAYGDNMSFDGTETADWDRYFAVNVTGAAELTRLLAERMAPRASVVFVNSGLGLRASGTSVPYSAAKAALKSLADGIRPEFNARGVSVTTVYPGQIATAMLERNVASAGRAWEPERYIQPDDLARLIVQVADPTTSYQLTEVVARPLQEPW